LVDELIWIIKLNGAFMARRDLPSYIRSRLSFEDLSSSRSILQLIDRQGAVTQVQAAEAVGLSSGTGNLHFQKLEHMGLIRRADSIRGGGRGRATIVWELEQDKNLCLLLVFDVPFFQATLVDFKGNVVLQKRQDLTGIADSRALTAEVENFVNAALVKAQRIGGVIRQAFAGVPGLFEPKSSVIRNAANFPALNGIDFRRWMQEHYDLPCFCGSLGLAFYYGEARRLAADTRTMVVFWDLGVGAVAGVGERIISHTGDSLLSEIGHIRVRRNGRPCRCGRRGCLEAYSGGWAMIEALQDKKIKSLEELRSAVLAGCPDAVKAACDAARLLGSSLCWPLQIMQSERLIISGPLSSVFPAVRSALLEGLASTFEDEEIAALDPAASEDAALAMQTGAYLFARRLFFYPEV